MYSKLVRNFKAIVFLGTPHRGTDLAGLLNRLLTVAFSRRVFVTELVANSDSIRAINDAFRHRSSALQLISFTESAGVRGVGVFLAVLNLLTL
jgi:triacylglycerol esterase/lipase EstA (alpha/beta hydrolase family)